MVYRNKKNYIRKCECGERLRFIGTNWICRKCQRTNKEQKEALDLYLRLKNLKRIFNDYYY